MGHKLFQVLLLAGLLTIAGCGGSDSCRVIGLNVAPQSATVDHAATAPANSQSFAASNLFGGGSGICTVNASAPVNSNWTVSDSSVHLSAAQGVSVTATCTAAVANPVTVKATAVPDPTLTGQATLVCK
jgi:hypothetical protein